VTEWQSADDRNNRERVNRARQAAEDLFKPAPRISEAKSSDVPSSEAVSTELPARRQPRIFNLPPRVTPGSQAEPPAEPKPMRRKPVTRRASGAVPSSQIGRVRALTNYGMTPEQVAELYDVTVGEIERIIGASTHPEKSR
jgi:hypothetical protein